MMLPVDDLKGASSAIAPNSEWVRNSRESMWGGQGVQVGNKLSERDCAPLRGRCNNVWKLGQNTGQGATRDLGQTGRQHSTVVLQKASCTSASAVVSC